MPPKRFLTHLGEHIDKSKIREMCRLMELSKEEETLVMARFCDGLNIDQVASHPYNISPDRQRRMVPMIEDKMMGWIQDHLGFFNTRQIKILNRWEPPE